MQDAFPLLLLVGFFLVMWLLFIRPQQRRQRELGDMQRTLEVGDEVMLTSGVYGVLHEIDDDSARLEVADGVVIRVARAAIGRLLAPVDDEEPPAEDSQTEASQTGDSQTGDSQTGDSQTRDIDVPEEN